MLSRPPSRRMHDRRDFVIQISSIDAQVRCLPRDGTVRLPGRGWWERSPLLPPRSTESDQCLARNADRQDSHVVMRAAPNHRRHQLIAQLGDVQRRQ